jgi:hypothetical protein
MIIGVHTPAGIIGLPASGRRLANCTVRLSDARLDGCALLPLFEAAGAVRAVLMLSARRRECRVLPWAPGLFQVPILGTVRIQTTLTDGLAEATRLGDLWFHDARGVIELAARSLRELPCRNAATALPPGIVALAYRRDLARVSGAWTKDRNGLSLRCWRPDQLPARTVPERTSPAPRTPAAWRLDPAWMR